MERLFRSTFEDGPRMNRSHFTSLLLSSLALAACAADPADAPAEHVSADGAEARAARSVPFAPYTDATATPPAARGERVQLIESLAEYKTVFGGRARATGVDFRRESIVVYSAGAQRTGGYFPSVVGVRAKGASLHVATRLVTPGDCLVTMALTNPHAVVRIARQIATALKHERTEQDRVCDPCRTTVCAGGTVCQARQVQCITTPCDPVAECVPAVPSCEGFVCGADEECQLREVQCITTPCHPQPTCVPLPEPVSPCAYTLCAPGTRCVVEDGEAVCR